VRRTERFKRWARVAATPALLRDLLARHHGSVLYVAREYGMTRQAVWWRAERFGLIGYVRELCERYVAEGQRARAAAAPVARPRPPRPERTTLSLLAAEGQDGATALRLLLEAHHGSPAALARGVGVDRATVYKWMRRYDLTRYAQELRGRVRATYSFPA